MDAKNPLVTIYIPTYNRLPLLKRAITSVRNQIYKNLEIIIVDDCSTDGTIEYLNDLSKEDKRIKIILKEKNTGACDSRNLAIFAAKGEYITGLDDDDYFLENRITDFIDHIHLLDKAVFLFTTITIIGKNGNHIKSIMRKYFYKYFYKNKVNFHALSHRNWVGNQIFIKTEILRKCGGFDINMKAWQDYDCWCRILLSTRGYGRRINCFNYMYDNCMERIRITNKEKSKIARQILCRKYLPNSSLAKLKFCFIEDVNDLSFQQKIKSLFYFFSIWDVYLIFRWLYNFLAKK